MIGMSDTYLTTDEAMWAMKISRITLYRWIKAGKIPFTKAGSTYRFKKVDIDDFLHGKPVAASAPEAIIAPSRHPLVITARDIEVWASHGNKVAEQILPELVRRLLQATQKSAGITELYIPSGDSVGQPGWDGKVQASEPHTYVSSGVSAWEMGIGEPQNKANSDYGKRTKEPLNVTPSETTFTFVTAQRWSGKDEWAYKKNESGEWAAVRVLDANDLEAWLDMSSAVKRWFMGVLGRSQSGIVDLATYWEEWSTETRPPLTTALIIAGRSEQQEAVQKKLKESNSGIIIISAASNPEAIAFLAASVMELPDDESGAILSSALVISSQEVWDETVASTESLILVAAFDNPDRLAHALSKNHKVIVPLDMSIDTEDKGISLKAPKKEVVKNELQKIGLPEKQAESLAALGRHSMLSMWRRLAIAGSIQRPEWVGDAAVLIPALLVGRWDGAVEADRIIISKIADCDYDEYIERLESVRVKPDSPVGKIGQKWFVASKEDAWHLVSGQITGKHMEHFRNGVVEVLTEIDPAYTLPYKERWMAGIHGKKLKHSSDIRNSLADSLAFMAVRFNQKKIGDFEANVIAASIVTSIFEAAYNDRSGHLWATLSNSVLPLLAEAAPNEFLTVLEKELKTTPPKIKFIFQDNEEDSSFSSHSPHTGILWALENFAWSPDFLIRSSYALSRLDELDPGGKLVNRPLGSLKDIFLSWHPQTTASVSQREEALESIITHYPDVGWKLLVAVLPDQHSFTTGSHVPKWREWELDKQTVTYADLYQFVSAVTSLMLKNAGNDASKWADILESYENIPPETQDEVANLLAKMRLDKLGESGQALLWDKVRNIVNKNKRFAKQSWAIKKEVLDKLLPALAHLKPNNTIDKYKWLFGHDPNLPIEDSDDAAWEKYEVKVREARIDAVTNIYREGGVDLLMQLSHHVESIQYLGVAVGEAAILVDADYENVLAHLSGKDSSYEFARGVILGRFYPEDWKWAEKIIAQSDALKEATNLGSFLNLLPLSTKTWRIVDISSPETQKYYWENSPAYGLHGDENYVRLTEELLKAGQPYTALEALSLYTERAENKPDCDLVFRAFEAFIKSDPKKVGRVDLAMFSHHASRLLKYLDSQQNVDKSRLAQIEWGLLPALKHERKPKILYEELATNPKFFAEVVGWVYRRRGSKKRKLTKEEETRARLGSELLESWNMIPGTTNGKIDQQDLLAWVKTAREMLEKSGRIAIGDQIIGKVLAHSKVDDDGAWPLIAVRNAIEAIESDDLEQGIRLAVYNNRGVTTRSIGEGGGQERELAQKYNNYADKVKFRWPHTAFVLLKIADTWRLEGERQDNDALEDEIA